MIVENKLFIRKNIISSVRKYCKFTLGKAVLIKYDAIIYFDNRKFLNLKVQRKFLCNQSTYRLLIDIGQEFKEFFT